MIEETCQVPEFRSDRTTPRDLTREVHIFWTEREAELKRRFSDEFCYSVDKEFKPFSDGHVLVYNAMLMQGPCAFLPTISGVYPEDIISICVFGTDGTPLLCVDGLDHCDSGEYYGGSADIHTGNYLVPLNLFYRGSTRSDVDEEEEDSGQRLQCNHSHPRCLSHKCAHACCVAEKSIGLPKSALRRQLGANGVGIRFDLSCRKYYETGSIGIFEPDVIKQAA